MYEMSLQHLAVHEKSKGMLTEGTHNVGACHTGPESGLKEQEQLQQQNKQHGIGLLLKVQSKYPQIHSSRNKGFHK